MKGHLTKMSSKHGYKNLQSSNFVKAKVVKITQQLNFQIVFLIPSRYGKLILDSKLNSDLQMVADITSQILDALDYIQWRGRVYLNLEPSNIIVCSGRSLGKTLQV